MAAVLFQSCSGLCSDLCTSCGKVCSFPCTLCSSICKPVCESIKTACSNSFCFYVAVTLGLNVVPIAFGVQALLYPGCRGSQWLLLNSLLCVAHVITAFYLAGQSKSWNETVKTLCYDPWIAVYIVACAVFFIWLYVGGSWSAKGEMANGNCPDNIASLTKYSIYCGFAFAHVGVSALAISSVLSMCMEKGVKPSQIIGVYARAMSLPLSMCMGKGSNTSTPVNSSPKIGLQYVPPFKATPV
mmetsp:Transcript_756/g.1190  ORF Transcript_756/g.1190 Transcript_756/m.1190 type:complete len:242 (-) Transcript_756:167-892(-)|eukprot:CAMPEP_0203674346 /NCGR_PEP_ID=MMETSP0090-20130426/15833_1 /ASSEMBLY_ACC=CAM_ASM_001088 /TAXON_ID=426623 /ORGANISM="Chaetoceros affinis, Strain CCMP159" /LENGTH=241 /DNA_ID=CAMNT_0050540199 /DNA_START=192 /DNA_END=917 /DNA_ORIENTATION=-